jgi:hypothetical protein
MMPKEQRLKKIKILKLLPILHQYVFQALQKSPIVLLWGEI